MTKSIKKIIDNETYMVGNFNVNVYSGYEADGLEYLMIVIDKFNGNTQIARGRYYILNNNDSINMEIFLHESLTENNIERIMTYPDNYRFTIDEIKENFSLENLQGLNLSIEFFKEDGENSMFIGLDDGTGAKYKFNSIENIGQNLINYLNTYYR